MGKKDREWETKGISAPPEWWRRVEAAQEQLGIISRSNFVRIAVDDYLKDSPADNRRSKRTPA